MADVIGIGIGAIIGACCVDNTINYLANLPLVRDRVTQAAVRSLKGMIFSTIPYGLGSFLKSIEDVPGGPPVGVGLSFQIAGMAASILISAKGDKKALAAGAATAAACTLAINPLAGFLMGTFAAYTVKNSHDQQRIQNELARNSQLASISVEMPPLPVPPIKAALVNSFNSAVTRSPNPVSQIAIDRKENIDRKEGIEGKTVVANATAQ